MNRGVKALAAGVLAIVAAPILATLAVIGWPVLAVIAFQALSEPLREALGLTVSEDPA